jgi:hypothetical protein
LLGERGGTLDALTTATGEDCAGAGGGGTFALGAAMGLIIRGTVIGLISDFVLIGFLFWCFSTNSTGVLIFPHLPHFPRLVTAVSDLKAVFLSI